MENKMTFQLQEEIELAAKDYDSKFVVEGNFKNSFHCATSFKAGAQALYELLLKDGGENWDADKKETQSAFWHLDNPNIKSISQAYYMGMAQQYVEAQAQIVALKAELAEQKEYIAQLENASDTQSNQYHQMREKLEAEVAELKEANANCISLFLHESRMQESEKMYYEMELLYLKEKEEAGMWRKRSSYWKCCSLSGEVGTESAEPK